MSKNVFRPRLRPASTVYEYPWTVLGGEVGGGGNDMVEKVWLGNFKDAYHMKFWMNRSYVPRHLCVREGAPGASRFLTHESSIGIS